ncbi:MAG: hypothetical protein HN396_04475 [Gemmatimonadales bacterium]|jgi:hypothetical protein|nr:hypothetical protein [Gemmatimonadales bacterium]
MQPTTHKAVVSATFDIEDLMDDTAVESVIREMRTRWGAEVKLANGKLTLTVKLESDEDQDVDAREVEAALDACRGVFAHASAGRIPQLALFDSSTGEIQPRSNSRDVV